MSLKSHGTRHKPKVLFYVQHLLGIGHLKRAWALAHAMGQEALDVHLICGGILPDDLKNDFRQIIQLPALHASKDNFSKLLDSDGDAVDSQWKAQRRQLLLEHLARTSPDIILVETYPFGRRQMRFELTPFLDAAIEMRARPKIFSSIRDIVQQRPQKRMQETVDIVKRYFDGVFVHGDPSFIKFEESFSAANAIRNQLIYTGYVFLPIDTDTTSQRKKEVIVSAGGGAVGDELLLTSVQARNLTSLSDMSWRVLVGPNLSPATRSKLVELTTDSDLIHVESNRADFAQLLSKCSMSISQAGYNTMMDVLTAKVPAVVVPFVGSGETEQSLRAEKLQQAGIVKMVKESDLNVNTLAAAIDQAASSIVQPKTQISMDGAHTTARYLRQMFELTNA